MPADSPTVPMAENTSSSTSSKGNLCTQDITNSADTRIVKFSPNTMDAVLMFSSPMRRLSTLVPVVLARLEKMYAPMTTMVVVLIPPAVDPEFPPINISIKSIALESSGHALKSQVEKPVVVMMDATWKDDCLTDSEKLPYME